MTEAEAKTKWCPQARQGTGRATEDKDGKKTGKWAILEHPGINCALIIGHPEPDNNFRVRCIGNKCMAWRWSEPQEQEIPMVGEPEDRKGYCGAYGKPEY